MQNSFSVFDFGARSGDAFTRRVLVPLATLLGIAILFVTGTVVMSSIGQNQIEVEQSTALAKTAVEVKKREIARNLQDYAIWEDAYKNLHTTLNVEWASAYGNVGANIFDGLGYDLALVVDYQGRIVYSVVGGVPQSRDAEAAAPTGFADLVAAGIRADKPAVGFLRSARGILLVAATPILAPSIDKLSIPLERRTTMIFAKALDNSFAKRIGEDYLLREFVVEDARPLSGTSLPLTDLAGETIGYLSWKPATPGTQLLSVLLPPLAIAVVVLGFFGWTVVRKLHQFTEDLRESTSTVETYAQTLEESEARFRDVAEASSDWIWETDADGHLFSLSSRFSDVTGMSAATVLGKPMEEFFSKEHDDAGWKRFEQSSREHTAFRDVRCTYLDVDGRRRVCRLAGRPVFMTSSQFNGFRGTATDITDEVAAHARANHLALHDALTELPNRLLFRERLVHALGDREQTRLGLAVLCLDLDHFKEINDTLGHGAGDMLLQQLAARLHGCVGHRDTVARLGGDEFAVIQIGASSPADTAELARRIVDIVKQPFSVDGQELHIGVSIGVALPDHADDPDKLLKNADIALYRAKQGGRGIARFFEPQMDVELQDRKALEHDLRQAILKQEFEVHYQPLVDLETKKIDAVEALVRWHHPVRGLVAPNDFIPMAEETGLIIAIGEWVLRTACRQALYWPGLRVAVNLSPVQFRHRELVETVRQVLEETGLEPDRLELEITESVLINDAVVALEILSALKLLGVQIAMDDFGTGYSSLGYLNSFPFDKIKIDRSFITTLEDKEKSLAIVRSVIGLSESLGMRTTAEGVETAEQATILHGEGCRQVQGYYFSRAIPALEMTAFLGNWEQFRPKGRVIRMSGQTAVQS